MASMGMRSACAATDQASTSSRCNNSPWRRPSSRAARHRCNGSRFNEFSLWRGESPTQSAPPPRGVVPGARTVATQVLTPYQAMDRLYASIHQTADEHFGAFYSTELGGITTHPAGMLVHIDDHMVHAGDAVFDTALLVDGHLYQLHQHLLRFKRSAYMAGLPLPLSDPLLLRVILDTAAASRMKNGLVKFWASAGRGSMRPDRGDCLEPVLYVMVSSETTKPSTTPETGLAACSSTVAPKPAPFSNIKSTNYLPNVMAQVQAEQQGLDVGVFVDDKGNVLEGPNSNFAMVTQEGVLVTPPYDSILAGITIQTLVQLVQQELKATGKAASGAITGVQQRPIHADEVTQAREAMLVGSTKLAVPITRWNGKAVGDGKPGPAAAAAAAMLLKHRQPTEGSTEHIAVPYDSMIGKV